MSTTATRTARLTQPPSAPVDRSAARRVLTGSARSVGGPAERPVLRIVADDERAPVFTRVLPAVEIPETRQVRLDDFFTPEYDGDDLRLDLAAPRPARVRLTHRGRVAVLVVSVVAALGLAFAAASASLANDHPEQTRVVVVTPGQTLWDISTGAAAATGSGDVRSMMSHIEAINHLDSTSLQAGQHLRIPR